MPASDYEPFPRCSNCAAQLKAEYRFCYNCGQAVNQSSAGAGSDDKTLVLPQWAPPIAPGDDFADRFLVERELGSGGMGVVYLIQDKVSGFKLALKILKPEFSRDSAATRRFEREIRILASLRHAAVPGIVEWGIYNESLFFISELVEGEDLGQLLSRRQKLPHHEALPLIMTVAEALASAHQVGIVHRDLKPSNVMVAKDGKVFLIDFGMARSISRELTRLTETGLIVGTPQYMSPEQLNSQQADERSDIYSLGVLLYEMLTGIVPFSGDSMLVIASKLLREKPRAPRELNPAIPFWLERIVLRCLEKDPSLRYWSVPELLTDLRKDHSGSSVKRSTLANGDSVLEDPSGSKGWVLSILAASERPTWTADVCLHFRDGFYRLLSRSAPSAARQTWEYRFEYWPESIVMRRIIDYETETALEAGRGSMFSRARKWLGGDPSKGA